MNFQSVMAYQHQEYPKFLYHPTLAPEGKIFQNAEETKGLNRKGWVDSPAKFSQQRVRRLALLQRYRRLTFWNKFGVWGSLASIVGLGLYFWPDNRSDGPRQVTQVQGSPGATILQPGRDIVIQPTAPASSPARPVLLPQQQRLLELLVEYQKKFGANRLVVSRRDGSLHFDDDPKRGGEISVVRDIFGAVTAHNAGRFEELVQSMPSEYVRLVAEARLDNPFVLNVTAAGVAYLADRR